MTNAPLFPTGGYLSGNRYSSHATVARVDDLAAAASRRKLRMDVRHDPSDPMSDEPHYPAWKVTLFVIVFCGAFWAGIAYLAMRLFG